MEGFILKSGKGGGGAFIFGNLSYSKNWLEDFEFEGFRGGIQERPV